MMVMSVVDDVVVVVDVVLLLLLFVLDDDIVIVVVDALQLLRQHFLKQLQINLFDIVHHLQKMNKDNSYFIGCKKNTDDKKDKKKE